MAKHREFSQDDKIETLELLRVYRQQPSARLRDRLVLLNLGLVRKEASYWVERSTDSFDDLLQVGSIGLIGAIERFEPDRGYAFSSLALRYIRGEIQHYLRDKSSTLRMPRRWQEKYEQAYRVCRQLRDQLNREPSNREIAECLGITTEEWQEIKLAHWNRSPMSLDAPVRHEEDSTCLAEVVADTKTCSQSDRDDAIGIERALANLEKLTREVLERVYLEDLTQREVAKLLGVSPVTISRHMKKGLLTLKCAMA